MYNRNSAANLKRGFVKGKSGNPKGRPKMPDIDRLISKVMSDERDGVTAVEAILIKQRQLALTGNQRAAEYLLDRAYGKPKQSIDMQTESSPTEIRLSQVETHETEVARSEQEIIDRMKKDGEWRE